LRHLLWASRWNFSGGMVMFKACIISGCEGVAKRKGLCDKHDARRRRHGDALIVLKTKSPSGAPKKFLYETAIHFRGQECLLWPYAKDRNGYGNLVVDGSLKTAHRIVCAVVNGPPPSDKHESAHSCGNSVCVNPLHLRWATHAENMSDRILHGTDNRGERCSSAKLTSAEVLEIRRARKNHDRATVAGRFGVSVDAIYDIDKRRSWSWLE
jgi:hypothetical protein